MIAKITILFAVLSVAYGGVLLAGSPPASTVRLANVVQAPIVAGPALTYAAAAPAPLPIAAPQPVLTYAAAPAAAVIPAPITYSAPAKVVQTIEPVEQHGYKIAY